jgi:DNA-binding protein H-NS
MQPKKSSLTTLSNEALCKLRDEIADILKSRAEDLRRELDRLTGRAVADGGDANGGGKWSRGPRKKVVPKFRGPDGETWTGRGMKPRWLTSALNEGKQLNDFLITARDEGLDDEHRDQTRTRDAEGGNGR